MTKNLFFQLPFFFDPVQLAADLERCLALVWKPHFNAQDYQGSWTSIALRSPSGRADDIVTFTANGEFHDSPLLGECAYFQQALAQFECQKETARLLRLNPQSTIKEHHDYQLGYEYGIFRLHIPIATNAAIQFRVGGVDLPMRAGECWYANFHQPHSVVNASEEARIHLVIDCIRNGWSDQLFAQVGFDFEEARRLTEPDAATVKLMLAQLETMNTPAAAELIARYRARDGGGR